jgi:formylmethanofuran dehydrogenase subunit E
MNRIQYMRKAYFVAGLIIAVLLIAGCNNQLSSKRNQTIYGSGFDLESCDEITEKDIHELCLKIYETDSEEFEAILLTNKFHQHIGPNNIYGAKMALYAKKLLNGKNHEIIVISEAGTKPPISCLNDGIMVAVGSTFGRGLISNVKDSNKLAATFKYGNKSVRLEVKPDKLKITQEYIANSRITHGGLTDDYFKDVRNMGLFVWENMSQEDLFIVTYPEEEKNNCEFNEINLNAYFNSLHNLLHITSNEKDIIEFIDKHPCVKEGFVDQSGYPTIIKSTWKSNNKIIEYSH